MRNDPFEGMRQHEFGFWQIAQMPSQEELQDYYAQRYYQEARGSYELSYSEDELKYIQAKLRQRYAILQSRVPSTGRMLDVGCGEGFSLSYFSDMGWNVRGLDFSSAGVGSQNPKVLDRLATGDLFELIKAEIANGEKYDLIWLQNVLEHVLDPIGLLLSLRGLVTSNGVLVTTVPNDFSDLQLRTFSEQKVDKTYWIAPPDHISYFTAKSLRTTGEKTGWSCFELLADFPIDWFLFHPGSNYITDKSKGKMAHRARIEIENLVAQRPAEDVNAFYSAMARVGFGRDLTAFFEPSA